MGSERPKHHDEVSFMTGLLTSHLLVFLDFPLISVI